MRKIITTSIFLAVIAMTGPASLLAQQLPTTQQPPMVVEADRDNGQPTIPGDGDTFQQVVAKLIVKGADFIIIFLVGLTVLVFMYGLMRYMFKGASSDTARTEGRKLMLWGLIGIFVMVSVWGLVGVLSATIGHQSRAVPQFEPNGTFDDGRARTSDQRVFNESVTAVKKTFKEKYQDFMQSIRRVPQNVSNGARNASNFMQNLFGR